MGCNGLSWRGREGVKGGEGREGGEGANRNMSDEEAGRDTEVYRSEAPPGPPRTTDCHHL